VIYRLGAHQGFPALLGYLERDRVLAIPYDEVRAGPRRAGFTRLVALRVPVTECTRT
jgi:hypothetical protein